MFLYRLLLISYLTQNYSNNIQSKYQINYNNFKYINLESNEIIKEIVNIDKMQIDEEIIIEENNKYHVDYENDSLLHQIYINIQEHKILHP